jgi:GH35 family endo-1,4-beta-xylanase
MKILNKNKPEDKKSEVSDLKSYFQGQDFLSALKEANPDVQHLRLTNKVIDTIFSGDVFKLLQVSIFKDRFPKFYTFAMSLEILNKLLIEEFVLDEDKRQHFRDLINKFYAGTISIDGVGREQFLKALSNQLNQMDLEQIKKMRGLM